MPPGKVQSNLTVEKSEAQVVLKWSVPGGTCTVTGYGVYRGTLPWTMYNHAQLNCIVTGTTYTDASATLSYYYLVVPLNSSKEGSYGTDSSGSERPQALSPCLSQDLTAC